MSPQNKSSILMLFSNSTEYASPKDKKKKRNCNLLAYFKIKVRNLAFTTLNEND